MLYVCKCTNVHTYMCTYIYIYIYVCKCTNFHMYMCTYIYIHIDVWVNGECTYVGLQHTATYCNTLQHPATYEYTCRCVSQCSMYICICVHPRRHLNAVYIYICVHTYIYIQMCESMLNI